MKIAYIASSEFGCPPPEQQIQAALWVSAQVIEGMTARGHHTIYVGAGTSTVRASVVRSFGPAFFDVHPYDDWVKLQEPERGKSLAAYQAKLHEYLLEELKRNSVDLVHFHTSPPIFSLPYEAKIRQPKVQTFHDPLLAEYDPMFNEYKDIETTHFVSISNAQRSGAPNLSFAQTIYNGIPIERYPMSHSPNDQLAFLGRVKRIKGIKDAVMATHQAGERLVVAGRPTYTEEAYLVREVYPFFDGNTIQHIGVVGHKAKVALLGQSKALLFPVQWEEPFGLAMIEAMACGTPVIAYNRGSVPEIISDGITGFIIDPDDTVRPRKGTWVIKKQGVEGLVEAIRRIGEIDRAACRRHVEAHFTAERMCGEYEKLYQELV